MNRQQMEIFYGVIRILNAEASWITGRMTIQACKTFIRSELAAQRKMAVELYIENQKGKKHERFSESQRMRTQQHTILIGDCREVLATLPDNSVHAIVTDPPYEIGFMGKKWDSTGIAHDPIVWSECLRVLKPGGVLLAFSATRTHHRMTCAIEDAGFEIRDMIAWVYGSGFPKTMDISKAIDQKLGATREKVRLDVSEVGNLKARQDSRPFIEEAKAKGFHEVDSDEAVTDDAKHWEGWKTALKPALEPICMARKPLDGTYAENILTHGVGGLNIDGCRIGPCEERSRNGDLWRKHLESPLNFTGKTIKRPKEGRFPTNLIHDGSDEIKAIFPETGKAKAFAPVGRRNNHPTARGSKSGSLVHQGGFTGTGDIEGHNDDGGNASRYFYSAKATKEDREAGTAMLAMKTFHRVSEGKSRLALDPKFAPVGRRNNHPTVKPTDLMRYLCRLVTPVDGVVLDPFMGSGSTGRGAILEGFDFIGIELSPEYAEIAAARINDAYSFTPDIEVDGHGQVVEQLKLAPVCKHCGNIFSRKAALECEAQTDTSQKQGCEA